MPDRPPRCIDHRIPAAQKSAPPPPIPTLRQSGITLRYAAPEGADVHLIHSWMNAPHVAKFWKQDWSLERWAARLSQMYDDSYERPYIAELDGRPVAYVELYRAARDVVADHYAAHPWDLGLHGAIGDTDLVGKNLAFLFWLDIIPAIFHAEPECEAVITDPEADHRVAVRLDQFVADRMGGENLGVVELPHKVAVLFRYPRAGAQELVEHH